MKLKDVMTESELAELDMDYEFGDPDKDDDDGKGFSRDSMVDQLAKVEQSGEGDDIVNPQRTVTTDDGKTHEVNPAQATTLGALARSDKVKPAIRAQYQKDIQTSDGLEYFLANPTGHPFVKSKEIVDRFVKKYLK